MTSNYSDTDGLTKIKLNENTAAFVVFFIKHSEMPKVKRSRKPPPDGWELIEPTLDELDQKMREGRSTEDVDYPVCSWKQPQRADDVGGEMLSAVTLGLLSMLRGVQVVLFNHWVVRSQALLSGFEAE